MRLVAPQHPAVANGPVSEPNRKFVVVLPWQQRRQQNLPRVSSPPTPRVRFLLLLLLLPFGVRRVVVCCYLVDPASSHMLVSKLKPCKCKFMP